VREAPHRGAPSGDVPGRDAASSVAAVGAPATMAATTATVATAATVPTATTAATATTDTATTDTASTATATTATATTATAANGDGRTRARVKVLLLEQGAATAAELGEAIGLSPAAIRRHLEAMLAEGDVVGRVQHVHGQRARGRPAKVFALTDAGRVRCGPHTYDDLASSAMRWISRNGGADAVSQFAADLVIDLEERCSTAIRQASDDPVSRAEALASALSAEGYAASASVIASGGQLCQHHCPVAHVAAEFPQLCEAETQVISRLVGSHVQRLATIANGDGVCTTHIPAATQIVPLARQKSDQERVNQPVERAHR
jgi:predicted ArsR family transcriptional regulator